MEVVANGEIQKGPRRYEVAIIYRTEGGDRSGRRGVSHFPAELDFGLNLRSGLVWARNGFGDSGRERSLSMVG